MKKFMKNFVMAVCLLVTVLLTSTQGQNTVPSVAWKIIFDSSPYNLNSSVVTKNHNYITLTNINSEADAGCKITCLNDLGDIVWQKIWTNPAFSSIVRNTMIDMNKEDGIIIVNKDSIIQIDYNGNVVKIIGIPMALSTSWLSIYKDAEHYFIVELDPYATQNKIWICDDDFNVIKSFSVPGTVGNIVMRDNSLFIASTRYGGGIDWNMSSDLGKYNLQGNLIWNKHFPDQIKAYCTISRESLYYATTKLLLTKPGMSWKIAKLDLDGNQTWTQDWLGDYPAESTDLALWVYNIVDLPTGGCIVVGGATQLDQTIGMVDQNALDAMAIAFDNQGNILWKIRETDGIDYNMNFFMTAHWNYQGYLMLSGNIITNTTNTGTNCVLWKYFVDGITAVRQESSEIPTNYSLSQNYPNPFNPTTTINLSVPQSGQVSLKIYDLLGREVAILVNEELNTGNYSTKFEAGNLASGIYIYKLTAPNFTSSKKMMLMK